MTSLQARMVITISDQSSFDGLQQKIIDAIQSHDNDIYVAFSPGNYIAHDNHITIKDMQSPTLNLHFVGNAATIIPAGLVYRDGDTYSGSFDSGTSWTSGIANVDNWTRINYADSPVEILDINSGRCRINSVETISDNLSPVFAYIHIPHWFRSSIYKIDKVLNQYIYFTANDLVLSYNNGYNVNDYNLSKRRIRYKLCNLEKSNEIVSVINGRVYLPSKVTSVREGTIHRFLTIDNCDFSSIEIVGVSFSGNCYGNSNSLIYIRNVNVKKLWVHKCSFHCMRSNVISLISTNNASIEKNKFEDCYYSCVVSDNKCRNTVVKKNSFTNIGMGLQNTFCIVCRGSNYCISDNQITDFGYGGIGVGVWYKSELVAPCNGIVENNDLSYSESYISDVDNNCIMDGGAIYVWTKNNGTIIRNNYIHGFSGIGGDRGIFCDDGAYNVQIYGNVNTGIANSYCIESRRVASVENIHTKGTGIDRSNVNIQIRDNIIDGNILFIGNEGLNNGCVLGVNYVLLKEHENLPRNTVRNIDNPQEIVVLTHTGEKRGRLGISRQSYRLLKKTDVWHSVRDYIIRKNK